MTSLAISLEPCSPWIVNNVRRSIRRVDDFNNFNSFDNQSQKEESSITLKKTTEQIIEELLLSKEPLITKRNQILNNPIKYFNPFHKKALDIINAELDRLDLAIYQVEAEKRPKESELKEIARLAREKLEAQTKYLQEEISRKAKEKKTANDL